MKRTIFINAHYKKELENLLTELKKIDKIQVSNIERLNCTLIFTIDYDNDKEISIAEDIISLFTQQKMIKEFKLQPIIAREIDKGMNSIPEGWWDLALELNQKLAEIDPDYKVIQYKYKFGEMRYYISPSENLPKEKADMMYEIEHMYEAKSRNICCKCSLNIEGNKHPRGPLCKRCSNNEN